MTKGSWKTHDLVDLFDSLRSGHLPLSVRQFTNQGMSFDPWMRIQKLAAGWPEHMEVETGESIMEFKIESGVPVPEKHEHKRQDTELLDAMGKLEPTQSVFIPTGSVEEAKKLAPRIMFRVKKYHTGKMFISRTVLPNGSNTECGTRFWRVS